MIFKTVDRAKADLIVAVDGKSVETLDDLLSYVESKKPGDKVMLTMMREGNEIAVAIVLEQSRE